MLVKPPAHHAATAADAIRQLNHTTLKPGNGWEEPGDAYQVIGSLGQMAGGANQALGQVWMLLSGLAGDGHLHSDRDTLDTDLTATLTALETARDAVGQLVTALSRAHSAAGHLGLQDDDTNTEDFPCGESGCLCYCPDGHVCGCDCPRCPYCQQHPEYCDCDE